MNDRTAALLLGMMAGAALWWAMRRRDTAAAASAAPAAAESPWFSDDLTDAAASAWNTAGDWIEETAAATWEPPAAAAPYLDAIRSAEDANGLPRYMLARLLYQESRYRQEVIDGRVTSSAGAVGIAQFMPATARDFGIDPRDPWQSIDAAARYLSQLYRRFGNWREALAAYNWGQGNVAAKGVDAAPAETRSYFASILSDLGLT